MIAGVDRTESLFAGEKIGMAHRIEKHEDVGPALLRLVVDDVAGARRLAASGSRKGIDKTRRRLKRARSVLRVLRRADGSTAANAAERLRKAAWLLADRRDADAVAASARSLHAFAAANDAGFDRVVLALDREARDTQARTTPVAEVDGLLAAAHRDLLIASGAFDGKDLLAEAIGRAYRRGRTAMRRASSSLATPDLHAWRKSVMDLWHLLRLARKRLPPSVRRHTARLGRLDEALGLDHDHAMLAERLALSPVGDPALMQQLALIAEQRHDLEAEAFALGKRIYKDKPKKFRRHLKIT
jgi:hypothetical protein